MTQENTPRIPAEENLWYQLLMACQHVAGDSDDDNRDPAYFWNGYQRHIISELRISSQFTPEMLAKLPDLTQGMYEPRQAELNKIHNAFQGNKELLLDMISNKNKISFTNVKFDDAVDFSGLYFCFPTNFGNARFSREAKFNGAEFLKTVNFDDAKFSKQADFKNAQFSNGAYFQNAQFSNTVDFNKAEFSRYVNFENAQFSDRAIFNDARFSDRVYFNDARFSGAAIFKNAEFTNMPYFYDTQFSKEANFNDAQFSNKADFRRARFLDITDFSMSKDTSSPPMVFAKATFKTRVPTFFNNQLHQDTDWSDTQWPDPSQLTKLRSTQQDIRAYERLRLLMQHHGRTGEEQNFFIREMAFKTQEARMKLFQHKAPKPETESKQPETGSKIKAVVKQICAKIKTIYAKIKQKIKQCVDFMVLWVYGLFNYGHSLIAPFLCLLALWLGGAFYYTYTACVKTIFDTDSDCVQSTLAAFGAAALRSAANMLPFFRFSPPDNIWPDSLWAVLIANLQSVFGLILFFLFALALRNALRMR